MYTATEKKAIQKQLDSILKCSGKCKSCKNLILETASTEKVIYYAFGCKKAKNFSPISESTKTLKDDLIECLTFELQ